MPACRPVAAGEEAVAVAAEAAEAEAEAEAEEEEEAPRSYRGSSPSRFPSRLAGR